LAFATFRLNRNFRLRFSATSQSPKTIYASFEPPHIQAHLVFLPHKAKTKKPKELEFPLLLKNNLQSIFICSKNCLYGIYFLLLPKKDKTICGKTEIWQVLENS